MDQQVGADDEPEGRDEHEQPQRRQ